MTIQFVAFCAGLFLVIVGTFGGGIQVKEVSIANLSPVSRLLSFILGCGLLLIFFVKPDLLAGGGAPDRSSDRAREQTVASVDQKPAIFNDAQTSAAVKERLAALENAERMAKAADDARKAAEERARAAEEARRQAEETARSASARPSNNASLVRYSFPANLNPDGDNWLALRSEPSASRGSRLMKLAPETLFTVLSEYGDWARIRLRTGETGWAHRNYIGCCKMAPP